LCVVLADDFMGKASVPLARLLNKASKSNDHKVGNNAHWFHSPCMSVLMRSCVN